MEDNALIRTDNLSKTELRYYEGTGVQFMADGKTPRCQAVSRGNMRKYRNEYAAKHGIAEAEKLRSDDLWPEGQCRLGAVEGTALCKYHGGKNPNTPKITTIERYMPINLQNILAEIGENHEIFSRYSDIRQLVARNAELYMLIEDGGGGINLWSDVWDGVDKIETGQVVLGVRLIRNALEHIKAEQDMWGEIRQNMQLMNQFSKTQFVMEKELQTMATVDQVSALLNKIYGAVVAAVTDNVEDNVVAERIIQRIAGEIRNSSGTSGRNVRTKARVIDPDPEVSATE